MLRYGVKFYTKSGDFGYSEYRDNFYEVLQLYVQDKNIRYRPTLWVLDEQHLFLGCTDYVRVHDFQFSQLTPETFNRYLDERIIDADDLLANVDRSAML